MVHLRSGRVIDSLPLMGIGNHLLSREAEKEHLLITPHGDREPDAFVLAGAPKLRSSLPLMGIGNAVVPVGVATMQLLSLPLMGIGNENRMVRQHLECRCRSLPLMGIGNAL